jgi:transcriptional/translational regulatory protein YebC/TACO1
LATPGSVKWLFEQKGIFEIDSVDENISLEIIENGTEDIEECDDSLIIYTDSNNIEQLKSFFLQKDINILSLNLGWKPKIKLSLESGKYRSLFEDLQGLEAVENLYTNI